MLQVNVQTVPILQPTALAETVNECLLHSLLQPFSSTEGRAAPTLSFSDSF